MSKEIYLTAELKEIYMKDFAKVLECTRDGWGLDSGIKDKLIAINANNNIQTLYSDEFNFSKLARVEPRASPPKSYLRICYTKSVELRIFRYVIPLLIVEMQKENGCKFYYMFKEPSDNSNIQEGTSPCCEIGCLIDKDYFRVNSILLTLETSDIFTHIIFWETVTKELSTIAP